MQHFFASFSFKYTHTLLPAFLFQVHLLILKMGWTETLFVCVCVCGQEEREKEAKKKEEETRAGEMCV